ncbi:hypothetical protein JCM5350_004968 [Sporobolomyces pararoseus]
MRSFTLFAAVVAVIPAIFAQTTVPPCVLTCIGQASALTSCQTADAQCLCSSQTFLDGVSACMIQSCSADELSIGVGFGEQYCASVGVQVSIPSSLGEATETGSSSQASETSSSSPAASSASASPTVNSSSASSVISSAASSVSQPIAASGSNGASAASPSQTGAASSIQARSALAFVGVVGAALVF